MASIIRSTDSVFIKDSALSSPLPDDVSADLAGVLQVLLVDLINMSLQTKQMHWCLTGAEFPTLHAKLDEITDLARGAYDTLAERCVQLAVAPNGTPMAVAQSGLEQVQPGFVDGQTVLSFLSMMLMTMAQKVRGAIQATGSRDLLTQDLLFKIGEDLEKQHWMINAQIAS